MRFLATFLLLLCIIIVCGVDAFVAPGTRSHSLLSSKLLSTVATPPERVAPDAGYVPDWEDRPGLAPEEFLQSDMTKPDLAGMYECPLTRWDTKEYVGVYVDASN
jgi:hypothetical protein